MKSCRMGRFSVRPFGRPFVRPPLWASQPGLRPSQPGLRPSQLGLRPSQLGLRPSQPDLRPSQPCLKPEARLAGWLGLRPGRLGLRPDWMAQRGEWTDKLTNGRTENLPILQNFVPYQGRCPASPHENQGESRAGQGNR